MWLAISSDRSTDRFANGISISYTPILYIFRQIGQFNRLISSTFAQVNDLESRLYVSFESLHQFVPLFSCRRHRNLRET